MRPGRTQLIPGTERKSLWLEQNKRSNYEAGGVSRSQIFQGLLSLIHLVRLLSFSLEALGSHRGILSLRRTLLFPHLTYI